VIKINRSTVTPSEGWRRLARQEIENARSFFSDPARVEQEFSYRVYKDPETRDSVLKLCRNKCAYCESRNVGQVASEHFRPKAMIVELDGRTHKPGYWWLAAEWENIYASCADCTQNKGNRFPIAGKRMDFPARGPELEPELALLLDPCVDNPEQYLVFSEAGVVASRASDPVVAAELGARRYRSLDRGQITIDVLGLNRAGLVELRRAAARQLKDRFSLARVDVERLPKGVGSVEEAEAFFASLIDLDTSYVALQRQLLRRFVAEWYPQTVGAEVDRQRLSESDRSETQMIIRQRQHEESLHKSSIEDNPNLESRRTVKIATVEIENFRAIDRLEFEFGTGGWKVLLGENGVGKSSVLQAVALALMGAKHAKQLEVEPSSLLRRGAKAGFIRVRLAADAAPLEVRLKPRAIEYSAPDAGLRTILLGFGSARWLPRPGGFEPDRGEFLRVRNLFNPFVPLADTLGWLGGLRPGEFRKTEGALLRLLSLDSGERLRRRQGEAVMQPPKEPVSKAIPLRQLSDGYQAVLAMVGDILELLSRKRIDMAAAEGVVLIDEIGAHLHPRWQMQAVSRLRNAFPNLQFLVTTHDPLCLRGLHDGEILVLRRDTRNCIVAITELPSVEGLRVDQLLMSPHFGLISTMDEQLEQLFDEYYRLLAEPRLSKRQSERLQDLRGQLDRYEQLGTNRREQLMLEAIDEHLAKEADALHDRKDELLREETRAKLATILDEIDADPTTTGTAQ
jgi:uncharacterized protein (TIGR02646 family)